MQTKEIKTKMRSVANIKKITRTMEMVSVAKMRRATAAAQSLRDYALGALRILMSFVEKNELEHVYLEAGKGNKTLFVLISSNKGLCGAYNMNVGKRAKRYLEEQNLDPEQVGVVAIGKQAEKITRRLGLELIASFIEVGDVVDLDQVRPIFEVIREQFATDDYREVAVVYTEFIKAMQYEPRALPLIPVQPEAVRQLLLEDEEPEKILRAQYEFEPSAEVILDSVLPTLLQTVLLRALRESIAAEHSSRMVAMKGATDNAGSLLESLRLEYNKARQEAITREIAEISAGAQAT